MTRQCKLLIHLHQKFAYATAGTVSVISTDLRLSAIPLACPYMFPFRNAELITLTAAAWTRQSRREAEWEMLKDILNAICGRQG
jgi:hypothetical protein